MSKRETWTFLVLFYGGAAALIYGVYLISTWAAFIAGGGFAVLLATGVNLRAQEREAEKKSERIKL